MTGHEDLAANVGRNPGEIPGNGIDDDGNGYVVRAYADEGGAGAAAGGAGRQGCGWVLPGAPPAGLPRCVPLDRPLCPGLCGACCCCPAGRRQRLGL